MSSNSETTTHDELIPSSPLTSPLKLPEKPTISIGQQYKSGYDSDDEDGQDITTRLEKRRQLKASSIQQPMSSPVRTKSKQQQFQSKSLGEKYTLRTRNYIPFERKRRDEKRLQLALSHRGGEDEMAKFLEIQDGKEYLQYLEKMAAENVVEPDEIDWSEEQTIDPYEHELSDFERIEDEEIDMLIANLKL